MKNILILTDFSQKSWNSIEYTLNIFQNNTCIFYLLYADNNIENNFEYTDDNLEQVKVKNTVNSKIQKLVNKIDVSPLKGNHVFIPISAENDIIETSKVIAKEKEIDLIVVSTDTINSKGKITIDTISEDIITKVKCSVLAIPKKASFKGLKEIVFPTDYTNFYEAKLLEDLMNLLGYYKSSLRFLYLAKKDEELNKEQIWNKETLHDYFKDQPHSFHSEINEKLEVSIENLTSKIEVSLIVVAAKNLNILEQILFRPQQDNLKYYTKLPFLALHQSN